MISVASGQGDLVAVGYGSTILTSPDGVAWTKQPYASSNINFSHVMFGNGVFIIVPRSQLIFFPGGRRIETSLTGDILTSNDSIHWHRRFTSHASSFNGAIYGNGRFYLLGHGGHIMQSAPIFTLAASLTNGAFKLTLTGEVGRSYTIQTSTNLSTPNWIPWLSITNVNETTDLPNHSITNSPRLFFRALSP